MTDSCIHLLSMSKVSESVSVVDYLDLLSDISLQESISIYPSYYRSSKKPAAKRKASTHTKGAKLCSWNILLL